jgi:hypothetical protein
MPSAARTFRARSVEVFVGDFRVPKLIFYLLEWAETGI